MAEATLLGEAPTATDRAEQAARVHRVRGIERPRLRGFLRGRGRLCQENAGALVLGSKRQHTGEHLDGATDPHWLEGCSA